MARRDPFASFASDSTSPNSRGSCRTDLAQTLEQPGFGLFRGRLDVHRKDVLAEPGQKSRLDERRLPAARGTVDQPDLEGQVGVDLLDLSLPESDAVGQSIPIPRSGKQFQEEVGIMLIKRSQPSWDDLDRSLGRSRIAWRWAGVERIPGLIRAGCSWEPWGQRRGRAPVVWRNERRSSAMSLAVLYRSDARFESAFWQIRSSSLGIVSSIWRGGRGSVVVIDSMIVQRENHLGMVSCPVNNS